MEKIRTDLIIISTTAAFTKGLLKNIKLLELSEHLYKPVQKAFQVPYRPDNLKRATTEFIASDSQKLYGMSKFSPKKEREPYG